MNMDYINLALNGAKIIWHDSYNQCRPNIPDGINYHLVIYSGRKCERIWFYIIIYKDSCVRYFIQVTICHLKENETIPSLDRQTDEQTD